MTSLTECLRRNGLRERKVPEDVIRRMYNTLHGNLHLIVEEAKSYNIKVYYVDETKDFNISKLKVKAEI